MSGTLRSKNSKLPEMIARDVVIFVNDVNKPAGIWKGKLSFIDASICSIESHGSYYWTCHAEITDKRASKEWQNCEPLVNYEVKTYEEAFTDLIQSIEEQKQEVKGLQKRMKIERDVLYGALKAMCAPAKSCEDLNFLLKLATKQEGDKSL